MAHGETAPDGGEHAAGAGLAARLVRVEEHCGFTEHTVEQLSAEMAALNRRVAEMLRRVEGIERRLGELARPGGGKAEGGEGPTGAEGLGLGGDRDGGGAA